MNKCQACGMKLKNIGMTGVWNDDFYTRNVASYNHVNSNFNLTFLIE